eukprot:UN28032
MPCDERFYRSASMRPWTTRSFSSIFLFSCSSICDVVNFLAGTTGLAPFEALGTRTPFLTPVVGARLPEIPPRPADADDAAALLLTGVFFILSDW